MAILLFVTTFSFLLPSISNVLIYAQNSSPVMAPCTTYDSNTNTINVFCNTNLSNINNIINNRAILEKDSNGAWILNAILKVNPQANLIINHNDTSWIKITNNKNNQPNYISISGSAKIDGVKISSWDPRLNDAIKQNANGTILRPYINISNAVGNVNISNSELAFLGYKVYPSNGIVYELGKNGSRIMNNTFHDNWDGFYSNSAGFMTIQGNFFYNNLRNGLNTHTGSHDLNITDNIAYNNSKIGIGCSQNCYNILFYKNILHDNGDAGLMLSENVSNSTARKNFAYNENQGISIFSSHNNKVLENLLKLSDNGIFIGGNSSNNHIYNNSIIDTKIGIDFADHPKNNVLDKSNFLSNVTTPLFAER
jgi:mannuronan 5-epimerase